MTGPKFSFIDYLAAKKTVDDRALNRQVLQSLADHLPATTAEKPLQVLDIAAGLGTMLERLVEWQVVDNVLYTAVDLQPDCVAMAARRLPNWAEQEGFRVEVETDRIFSFDRGRQHIKVILEMADVFDFVTRKPNNQKWDLLIAHAFLDLVDVPTLLPDLISVLKPASLYYFSINFDGQTIFMPPIDPPLDRKIIDLYHRAMDEDHVKGLVEGGTRTGRYLFQHLQAAGAQIIEAGSSDWVVFPDRDGYPNNEAFFLHCIIDSIDHRLRYRTDFDIQPWLVQRHAQIEREELIYIAHQLDFVGKI